MPRRGAPITRWTLARETLLRQLWISGAGLGLISHETGASRSAIYAKRKALGLPKRNTGHFTDGHHINLYLDDEIWRIAKRGALRRGATLPGYLRALIRRDASVDGGTVETHGVNGTRRV